MAKKSSRSIIGMPPDWQVESDLECMLRCEQIEADPKRLKKVADLAKERMIQLGAVASETKKD